MEATPQKTSKWTNGVDLPSFFDLLNIVLRGALNYLAHCTVREVIGVRPPGSSGAPTGSQRALHGIWWLYQLSSTCLMRTSRWRNPQAFGLRGILGTFEVSSTCLERTSPRPQHHFGWPVWYSERSMRFPQRASRKPQRNENNLSITSTRFG